MQWFFLHRGKICGFSKEAQAFFRRKLGSCTNSLLLFHRITTRKSFVSKLLRFCPSLDIRPISSYNCRKIPRNGAFL